MKNNMPPAAGLSAYHHPPEQPAGSSNQSNHPYNGPYTRPNGAPAPAAQPPKKKRRFGCLGAFCVFLAVVLLAAGFFAVRGAVDGARREEYAARFEYGSTQTTEAKLLEALEAGTIDADGFVRQMAYSVYDRHLMDEPYASDTEVETAPDLYAYAQRYMQELSEETVLYLLENFFMTDVVIAENPREAAGGTGGGSTALGPALPGNAAGGGAAMLMQGAVPQTNDDVQTLDSYMYSPSDRFIFWYSTTGPGAVTDEQAQEMAQKVDGHVNKLEARLNTEWTYTPTGAGRAAMGLDNVFDLLTPTEEQLEMWKSYHSAFPVYLIETSQGGPDTLASYFNTVGFFTTLVISGVVNSPIIKAFFEAEEILGSVYSWPFITIKPSSMQEPANLDFILAHELTHHFQNFLGIKDLNGSSEALDLAADVAAAEVVMASEISPIANTHAKTYLQNTWVAPHDPQLNGYSGYLFGKSYIDIVPGGMDILLNAGALPTEELAAYYYNQAGGEDGYRPVMEDLAIRNVTKEYDKVSYKSAMLPSPRRDLTAPCQYQETITGSGIHYYYYSTALQRYKDVQLYWESKGARDVCYILLGRTPAGDYAVLQRGDMGARVSVQPDGKEYGAYEEIVLAVINHDYQIEEEYTVGLTTERLNGLVAGEKAGLAGYEAVFYREIGFDELSEALAALVAAVNGMEFEGQMGAAWDSLQQDLTAGTEQWERARETIPYNIMRVYAVPVTEMSADELHEDAGVLVSGLRITVMDRTTEEGERITARVGLHPLNYRFIELAVAMSDEAGELMLYYITLNA